jgi:exodeoxyribonuclease VII large subunit
VAVPVLQDLLDRLDETRDRVGRAIQNLSHRLKADLKLLGARPGMRQPDRRLRDLGQYLDELGARLDGGVCTVGRRTYTKFDRCVSRLTSVNPLAALRRGYTVTRSLAGRIVRSVKTVKIGDTLEVRFVDGFCRVDVKDVREESLGREG